MALEERGVPCIVIATSHFEALALQLGELQGFASRIAVIEHPLGGIGPDEVVVRARRVVEDILGLIR